MDGAEASCLYSTVSGMCGIISIRADDHEALTSRRVATVQILVVVANTPARPWRTDVEEGFVWTAVAHESVDPKP
ncbi:hypothetical protein JTB14_027916 [Gonioctena quinquepunctata]|nr:hypothetical protein JTB14_027916 [Gonioctena quinquepunctata]